MSSYFLLRDINNLSLKTAKIGAKMINSIRENLKISLTFSQKNLYAI